MRLIEIDPPVMKKLAAGLIVNLKLGGVFLKDTDVFQRDISQLLNSDYRDVFHLITSLAAVFPAFYHDIGATGDIRAFTEKIDTNHRMNDLVHFLRKQVHVESSSRTVLLIQRIMEFWMTGEQRLLEGLVPAEVYESLPRAYRLINLDAEPAAQALYEAARRHFSDVIDGHFWDFLGAVGKKPFLDFAASAELPDVSDAQRVDALGCFEEYFDTRFPAEMTKMLHFIKNMFGIDTSKTKIWKFLYDISDEEFRKMFENVRFLDISRVNIEKFITFLHVYRMIFDKYNFSDVRDIEKLEAYAREGLFAPPDGLFDRLHGNDAYAALGALLDLQYSLKWDILLSREVFEPLDTIEFKRHIAFGIPSMYGSYKEKKFDTLKVFFHCNLIRERLFESLVESCSVFSASASISRRARRVYAAFRPDVRDRRPVQPRDAFGPEPHGTRRTSGRPSSGTSSPASSPSTARCPTISTRCTSTSAPPSSTTTAPTASSRTTCPVKAGERRRHRRPLSAQPENALAAAPALRQRAHPPAGAHGPDTGERGRFRVPQPVCDGPARQGRSLLHDRTVPGKTFGFRALRSAVAGGG